MVSTSLATSALGQANATAGWADGFVKTNGEYVTIGSIMVKTNSSLDSEEYKRYCWRTDQLAKIMNSESVNTTGLIEVGAHELLKDYPKRTGGYDFLMIATERYGLKGERDKARSLARELIGGSAPEKVKLFAKGILNRLDSMNNPITLHFKSVDGREINLAALRGKVVLVDFWATDCAGCVAELPRVKAAYDKFHGQGLEVIGISCDTDKEKLNKFIVKNELPWPQYCDGKIQTENRLTQEFGIDGIPHMFLVDKKGCLRFDDVRASDQPQRKEDTTSVEEKITKLLAED